MAGFGRADGLVEAVFAYLQQIIGGCSDEEAEILIRIITPVLAAMRDRNSQKVE